MNSTTAQRITRITATKLVTDSGTHFGWLRTATTTPLNKCSAAVRKLVTTLQRGDVEMAHSNGGAELFFFDAYADDRRVRQSTIDAAMDAGWLTTAHATADFYVAETTGRNVWLCCDGMRPSITKVVASPKVSA